MSKGKLFVISGASGVGKGTVLKEVMKRRQDLRFSVSATTRPPRPSEVDGREYYFVTRERFEEMIRNGEFLEYDEHNSNYYGTPRRQALEKLEEGSVLLDIEPKGAAQVRQSAPEATLIFIMPPSMEELERRLRDRNDTPEDQIEMRLKRAVWEMEQRVWYDHVVVNDELERCVDEVLAILAKECGESA
ncbi:MAG: guanylate kinase [Candidatus Faecousia sp.]|nr:guanylate kinase [Clostridiales bacterium]MDY6180051.1 guanylate kinase [Candidatus Faecousia sp.]